MGKAGGIVSIISGILGFVAAVFTLFIGGVGSVFDEVGFSGVVSFGWGGLLASGAVIVFGALCGNAAGKWPGALVILSSILGAIFGGSLVAICMMMSLVGGLLCVVNPRDGGSTKVSEDTRGAINERKSLPNLSGKLTLAYLVAISALVVLSVILFNLTFVKPDHYVTDGDFIDAPRDTKRSKGPIDWDEVAMPSSQKEFVRIIESHRNQFRTASTDMAKGGVRFRRREAICSSRDTARADNWVGVISKVSSNNEGRGVLVVEIGNKVSLGTWNNALSDIGADTLIDPGSDVFSVASQLSSGERVNFSGSFVWNDKDCVDEMSLSLSDSIEMPRFVFKFDELSSFDQTDNQSAHDYISPGHQNSARSSEDSDRLQVKTDQGRRLGYATEHNGRPGQPESAANFLASRGVDGKSLYNSQDDNTTNEENKRAVEIQIASLPSVGGFVVNDAVASHDPRLRKNYVTLKSGAEVVVTGELKEEGLYRIVVDGYDDPLFLSKNSVALFE